MQSIESRFGWVIGDVKNAHPKLNDEECIVVLFYQHVVEKSFSTIEELSDIASSLYGNP